MKNITEHSSSRLTSTRNLKTILSNNDVLVRLRLLQLWCVDIFTESLKQNDVDFNTFINESMLKHDSPEQTPEHILTVMFDLKQSLIAYNDKLISCKKIIDIQNKYAKILHDIDESVPLGKMSEDDINSLISRNEKLINGINNLTINNVQ